MTDTTTIFECQRCGDCCRGAGGIILQKKDQKRLAEGFGMTEAEFIEKYAEEKGGRIRLRVREDLFCIFYNEKIRGCGVHLTRPDVCRAWPFFRGNLIDEMSWQMLEDYCPGVNHAAGHDEFARQGMDYLRAEGLLDEQDDNPPCALSVNGKEE